MTSMAKDYLESSMEFIKTNTSSLYNTLLNHDRNLDWQTLGENKWKVAGACLGTYVLYKAATRQRNLPPGPPSLPIMGGVYAIKDFTVNMTKELDRLSKKYGEIYSIDIGPTTWIVVTSVSLMKEVSLTRPADFSDRMAVLPDLFKDDFATGPFDERFKKNKKYAIHTVKQFGFGTAKGEETIVREVGELIKFIKKQEGKAFDLMPTIQVAATNVICTVWFNRRHDFDSKELKEFTALVKDWFKTVFEEGFAISGYMKLMPKWMFNFIFRKTIKRCQDVTDKIIDLFKERIKEHRETLDKDNPRDAIDVYLTDRDGEQGFSDEILAGTVLGLLVDAIDTLSVVLEWVFLYMCSYPDVQARIQQEIETVCGSSRPPRLADRQDMIYTEATIWEIFRHSNIMPFNGFRQAAKDTTLGGYNVPKGSTIMINAYTINTNPELWPQPEDFKPDRHLVNDGKLKQKTKDIITPFGKGPRMCVGEQLACSEVFLILTNILQQFTLTLPDGETKRSISDWDQTKPIPTPKAYNIKAIPR